VAHAEVVRRITQLGAVGAEVERDGQRATRMESSASDVERELADRNAHAIGSEVTGSIHSS